MESESMIILCKVKSFLEDSHGHLPLGIWWHYDLLGRKNNRLLREIMEFPSPQPGRSTQEILKTYYNIVLDNLL